MLPLTPPVKPMLATGIDRIPDRPGLLFEPKWDGFRCLVFRDGDDVVLQSRAGKPLTRYFPEVVDAVLAALPRRCVVDGELIVVTGHRMSFDALTERVHPAASRIAALAANSPASLIAFDLLALDDSVLFAVPFEQRRAAMAEVIERGQRVHLTPITGSTETAALWFRQFEGAGLDGLIGKAADGHYEPGKRAMLKIKHARTADCVVGGLRWHAASDPGHAVGSLLLGLYDEHGVLHHVGVIGSFPAARRVALVDELAPLRVGAEQGHPWLGETAPGQRLPGSENRWRAGEQPWVPLRCERVVEVGYEHTEGQHPKRFRLNPRFTRWRTDREPSSCRYDQLDEPASYDLDKVLDGDPG